MQVPFDSHETHTGDWVQRLSCFWLDRTATSEIPRRSFALWRRMQIDDYFFLLLLSYVLFFFSFLRARTALLPICAISRTCESIVLRIIWLLARHERTRTTGEDSRRSERLAWYLYFRSVTLSQTPARFLANRILDFPRARRASPRHRKPNWHDATLPPRISKLDCLQLGFGGAASSTYKRSCTNGTQNN